MRPFLLFHDNGDTSLFMNIRDLNEYADSNGIANPNYVKLERYVVCAFLLDGSIEYVHDTANPDEADALVEALGQKPEHENLDFYDTLN